MEDEQIPIFPKGNDISLRKNPVDPNTLTDECKKSRDRALPCLQIDIFNPGPFFRMSEDGASGRLPDTGGSADMVGMRVGEDKRMDPGFFSGIGLQGGKDGRYGCCSPGIDETGLFAAEIVYTYEAFDGGPLYRPDGKGQE